MVEDGYQELVVQTTQYTDYFNTKDMILMQFTGLYDKNGKEIYEGDIFEIDDYTNGVVVYFEGEGTFGIRCKDDEDEWNEPFSYYCFDRMEVLGNECENPELLGE